MTDKIQFVAFRLKDDQTYTKRWTELDEGIRQCAVGKYWPSSTSFTAFPSNLTADQIAAKLKNAINISTDLLIVGSLTHKVLIIVGKNDDDDIFDFCDFARRG